ncbi:YfbM family protein [Streptomyces sp. NPDC101490]|uniref:YfbM family protein n=1 Tax=Streptomyces sp. NPDC101490 TaxID=3366143 RepID=UPI00381101A9
MSMIGAYFRVTAAGLARALDDPDGALAHIEEVLEAEAEADPPPARARHFSTYKSWHLLDFLLKRSGFPVDVVHGEAPLGESGDWGYGPPHHLAPDRVRRAAEALEALTYDRLLDGVDPAELVVAEVYPSSWNDREALEWGRYWFDGLRLYFRAAARDGDAVILWVH